MVLNPGTCHYMLIGFHEPDKIILNGTVITSSNEKLLGVLVDKKS